MFTKRYNVSEENFAKIQQVAKERTGLDICGDSGMATESAVTIEWDYSNGVLELKCLKKPFFVSQGMIEKQFDSLVGMVVGA